MARKVKIKVEVELTVNLEEGETVDQLIQEMNYEFDYRPDNAENRITDTQILEHEVTDSK